MDNFTDLISGHGFEKQYGRHLTGLGSSGIEYLYSYSPPDENPNLRIEFDNCQHMSRLTLWESGALCIEVVSFRDSSTVLSETAELRSLNEFEDKLLSLIAHMETTATIH